MKTKWSFLMVLVLLATLAGGSAGLALGQAGILVISPMEGTVGTQVTITGTGFGDKPGEVLLGEDPCKVLTWSDAEITFLVDKPQRPDEYAITVLLHEKASEPLTFGAFAMRRPKITSGDLLVDGAAATVVGEYFGDKKGGLRVGYRADEAGGEMVIEDPKILDWSMNTIRFELPAGVTGQFVLAIRNEVGTGLALLHLAGGMLGSVAPIPDWGGRESLENANGVFYKSLSPDDNFYIFSANYNPGYGDNWRIQASILHPSDWTDTSISPPKSETEVPIQPLVVTDSAGKETLWVFHTGHMWSDNACCTVVWYTTYYDNGVFGTWDPAGWKSVPNVGIDERVTVAPVYDPRNHRISVYYDWNNTLRWFYSDDFGATWSDDALVGEEVGGVPAKHSFVSAIYWPSDTTTALVASTGQVVAVNNGEFRGVIGELTDSTWRPSLVDLGGQTALIYGQEPKMTRLNYPTSDNHMTWSWSEPETLVTLPDTGIPLTSYSFPWAAKGAVNKVGNDRHLYIFYGVHLAEAYTEESINRWYLHDEGILEPETDTPPITRTAFKQVSAGETHACAIRQDGMVECWGNGNDGKLDHPSAPFSQISAGNWTTCGVKTDHSIACWGKNDYSLVSNRPPGNNFTQVSVGLMVACGLKNDKSVVCWGDSGDGRLTPQTDMTQISAGQWHTCGIKSNGFIFCWGDDGGTGRNNPQKLPAGTTWKQVSAAAWHTCGIRSDGAAICWGDNDAKRVSPVTTLAAGLTYKEVSAGNWHTCALVSDGSIRCWGSNDDSRVSSMPTTGIFTHIEAGIRNTCAIRSDGAILCWGNNSDRQSLPPF